jgi:virginiamycin A acetyltransferase
MPLPSPDTRHPLILPDGTPHKGAVFLSAVIDHPRIDVGDYTYAFDADAPEDWAGRLAPYLFQFSPERLVIGRFCQIANGARFITASANHRYDGISTYPFAIFDGDPSGWPSMPSRFPDTVIGNDVWIGDGAAILPGARVGSGVIVGARAVVSGEVPDYAIVAGNPARVVRKRFSDEVIGRLMELAWWDWPIETIVAHEAEICGGDAAALQAVSPKA